MISHFKKLVGYRELLYSITVREIKVRYKQSFLGMSWAILQPLSMMLIFTVIFSKFAKIPSDGIPYPIFSYSALLPWTFFATSLSFASSSVVSNSDLVAKTYFPREIFPMASVAAAFVDYGIASVIFVFLLVLYRVSITLNLFFVFPILIIQIILTLAIAFFTSAINVRFRDVKYAVPLFIQLWMFASPIIYPISVVPERYRTIYMLNPMAGIIDGYRKVIVQGIFPNFQYLGISIAIALLIFFFSYKYFKKAEKTFADVI